MVLVRVRCAGCGSESIAGPTQQTPDPIAVDDFWVCGSCVAINVFTQDMELRLANDEDMAEANDYLIDRINEERHGIVQRLIGGST